jgi:hypothetical protein
MQAQLMERLSQRLLMVSHIDADRGQQWEAEPQ